jgi:uncharacterized membrane protein YhaH (DUF805 family)
MEKLSPIGWAVRPLKNYANFSGRASRAEFWWFFLFTMIVYFAGIIALGAAGSSLSAMNPAGAVMQGAFGIGMIFIGLFWLALFIPMLAVQFRRLHDTNRSGWWLGGFWLLYLVDIGLAFGMVGSAAATPGSPPNMGSFAAVGIIALVFFVYSIVLLVFFCLPGTKGQNRYGDDPYGASVEEVFA